MKIGIVGSEAAKFTPETEDHARLLIDSLLISATGVISGGCHLGGIDLWAEEAAGEWNLPAIIYRPAKLNWSQGYAPRNLLIARNSDEVHCITVRTLPDSYTGMRFPLCYHCAKEGPGFADVSHVKSGGCWTVHKARKMGKRGFLHVI